MCGLGLVKQEIMTLKTEDHVTHYRIDNHYQEPPSLSLFNYFCIYLIYYEVFGQVARGNSKDPDQAQSCNHKGVDNKHVVCHMISTI